MRINIIGPSASGKTKLADRIGRQTGIKHIDLDYLLFEFVQGKRVRVDDYVWQRNLKNTIEKDDWIIEGINPIKEIFEASDKIIYLKPCILITFYRQWKRYFTDVKQRKEHGFFNNLNLSRFIFLQYLHKAPKHEFENPRYNRLDKTEKWLERYTDKVIRY